MIKICNEAEDNAFITLFLACSGKEVETKHAKAGIIEACSLRQQRTPNIIYETNALTYFV